MGLIVKKLGRVAYEDAHRLQKTAVTERADETLSDDVLMLLEHEPVFTIGRGATDASLPTNSDLRVVESERGGDITWHGIGQLTGYWIRRLEGKERDLHRHLRLIEKQLIEALRSLGIDAIRNDGLTGVWVEDRKIASIGVAVRRWVAYHGFSLNVDVDSAIYETFTPCGLDGAIMTDISTVLDRPVGLDEVIAAVTDAFSCNP